MIDTLNPKQDYYINKKLINILDTETRRLRLLKSKLPISHNAARPRLSDRIKARPMEVMPGPIGTEPITSNQSDVENGDTPTEPGIQDLMDTSNDRTIEQNNSNVYEQDIRQVAKKLRNANKIIVLVGAGISTNYGIPVSEALFFKVILY